MLNLMAFIFDDAASDICYKLSADNCVHIVKDIQEAVKILRKNTTECVLISVKNKHLKLKVERSLGRPISIPIAVGDVRNASIYSDGFVAIIEEGEELHNYEALLNTLTAQMGRADKVLNRERKIDQDVGAGLVYELIECKQATLWAMATLAETRDTDTGTHLDRVKTLSNLICSNMDAEEFGITPEFIYDVSYASILHDIGKVGVPDEILYKPGELSNTEYTIMKTHSQIGGDTIEKVLGAYNNNSILKVAQQIALHHHEKWDGTGYPDGLAGQDIPLAARIVTIADAYDAIRSKRSYKDAKPHEEAMRLISECTGTQFDPYLVDKLMSLGNVVGLVYDSMADNVGA